MKNKKIIPAIFHRNTPEDYFKAALQTTDWIMDYGIPVKDGKYWRRSPETEDSEYHNVPFFGDRCMYCGSAGLGIYFLRVYEATGEEKYLQEARAAADHLIASYPGREFYPQTLQGEIGGILRVPGWAIGIYNGPAGEALFTELLYRKTGEQKYQDYVRLVADDLLEVSISEEQGIRWSEESDLVGDGGFVLFFILAYQSTGEQRYLDAACRAADYIASLAIDAPAGGKRWQLLDLRLIDFEEGDFFPNFSHGTSGIGWMFAALYKETHQKKYLELAKEAVTYLKSIAVGDENGTLIPYLDHPVKGPSYDKYYLSTCHGPVGSSLVFRLLYEITGEQEYLDWVKRLSRGIIRAGAPERNSWGYWNCFCQCCGAPGVLEHFVSVYELTGEEEFLRYARRTADVLIGDAVVTENKRRWYGAWTRTIPEKVRSFTGFYVGSAGASSSLLRLYGAEKGIGLSGIFEYLF